MENLAQVPIMEEKILLKSFEKPKAYNMVACGEEKVEDSFSKNG